MSSMLRLPIAISLGAVVGALSRYYLNLWFISRYGTTFPYSTLVINTTGCLGLGVVWAVASDRVVPISPELYSLITTGFFGAYTTFSTYGLETVLLAREGQRDLATIYALASAIGGIFSVHLGIIIAHWFSSRS